MIQTLQQWRLCATQRINSPFREDLYTNNITLEDALHHTNYFIIMKDDNHVYMIKHNAMQSLVAAKAENSYEEPRQYSSYDKQDNKKLIV